MHLRAHELQIAKIEKRLAREVKETFESRIRVQDLIAYQQNKKIVDYKQKDPPLAQGEFYPDRVTLDAGYDEKAAAIETDDHLIDRMCQYIESLADIALEEHKENFVNPEDLISYSEIRKGVVVNPQERKKPEMRPDCKDCVTRLFLNEFALFPNKDRGPLSEEAFQKLIKHILKMAAHYPENLELVLGSVPVIIKSKDSDELVVQNFVLAVSCGNPPEINIVPKSFSSAGDPEYKGTSRVMAVNNIIFSKKMTSFIDRLLNSGEVIKLEEINEIIALCNINFNHQDVNYINLINCLNDLAKLLQNPTSPLKDKSDIVFNFALKLLNLEKLLLKSATSKVLPHPALLQSAASGVNVIQYGGNIIRKTASGKKYRFVCDVCYDIYPAVGKGSAEERINTSRRKGQDFLPVFASHALISNPAFFLKENVVGETLSQADPKYSHDKHVADIEGVPKYFLSPLETKEFDSTFGSHTVVHIYPARLLARHKAELDESINRHNKFMVRLKALRLYREQQDLKGIEAIERMINFHILQDVLNTLHVFNTTLCKDKTPTENLLFMLELTLLNSLSSNNRNLQIDTLQKIVQISTPSVEQAFLKSLAPIAALAADLLKEEQEYSAAVMHKFKLETKSTPPMDLSAAELSEYWMRHSEERGHVDLMKSLILSKEYEEKGKSPIHLAAKSRHPDLLHALIEQQDEKINLDERTSKGATPLHLAAAQGNLGNILYLINKGANQLIEYRDGRTFFEILAEKDLDAAILFLKYKKEISQPLIQHLFARYSMCDASERAALQPMVMYIIGELIEQNETENLKKIFKDLSPKVDFYSMKPCSDMPVQSFAERLLRMTCEWKQNDSLKVVVAYVSRQKPYQFYKTFKLIEKELDQQISSCADKDKLALLQKQKCLYEAMLSVDPVTKNLSIESDETKSHLFKSSVINHVRARIDEINHAIESFDSTADKTQERKTP